MPHNAPQHSPLQPVGDHLKDELERRQWSQTEFAAILGRPEQLVSDLITGRTDVTFATALHLEAGLGIPAEDWMALHAAYVLNCERNEPSNKAQAAAIRAKAILNEHVIVAHLPAYSERGTDLPDPQTIADARTTFAPAPLTRDIATWVLAAVHRLYGSFTPGAPSKAKPGSWATLGENILRHTASLDGLARLPEVYASHGIDLIHIPPLPGQTHAAAAISATPRPLIAITGRGGRLDKVVASLTHATAAIAGGKTTTTIVGPDTSDLPTTVRDVGNSWLLPSLDPPTRVTKKWLEDTATKHGTHPAHVVGALQRGGHISEQSQLARGLPNTKTTLNDWTASP